ncbi:MAG: Lrp/AsnC family transcriptional regulator [Chloroflexi bacterium]|nr:Lrp/AsnC family transcriptional regulator [Chloroflexota bacterium]
MVEASGSPSPQDLDLLDRQLLNLLQSRFPLTERPFEAMGQEVGLAEEEVLRRVRRLKQKHVVRQISGIFDTRRLGYKTSLVAMGLPPEGLHKGALFINRHPGVSHNYAREGHRFNLWFTLAVPPSESLEDTVAGMASKTGATEYRILPTIRFFKIGVNFDMVKGEGAAYLYTPDDDQWNRVEPLTPFEVQVVRELQEDLLLEPRPFDAIAARLGLDLPRLFAYAADFQRRGVLRRYSAVLHHRRAGFKFNAMSVWRVPPERSAEVGRLLAASPWVTHCYERPTSSDWPYSHFAMVHATSRQKCEEVAQELSRKSGITDYLLLFSTREYKKTRVRYFV